MSSFLSQLNDRISKSDLSDGTIASVSCLVEGEHMRGNTKLAKVHALGMAEMIRLRGGLETIQRARRGKIVRADIIRSVDNLEFPMLPRPTKDSVSQINSATPTQHFRDVITKLYKSRALPELTSAMWTLSSVCQTVEAAWAGQMPLDATSFYESVLCLNHDVLNVQPQTAFDEVLKISILNFTQPMFRYCVFTEQSCIVRAKRLRIAQEKVDMSHYDENLVLWITFIGYMTSRQVDSEKEWFKTRLLSTLETMQISKSHFWIKVKTRLQEFIWTESIHDHIGRQFYDTLETDLMLRPPHLNNTCLCCNDLHMSQLGR